MTQADTLRGAARLIKRVNDYLQGAAMTLALTGDEKKARQIIERAALLNMAEVNIKTVAGDLERAEQ